MSDFEKAVALWREWNEKINVVSRKDAENIYNHHILHSLAIQEYMKRSGLDAESILDVGTGGGFPGIPLAVEMPNVRFTLCDSIGKKTIVASAVAEGLGLQNVKVLNCRAEAIGEKFDFVVSRAVTSLDNFYPWVKGKYRKGILYLKGGDVETEIAELCRKCKVPREKVSIWPISDWLDDPYYAEKYVIHISA